MRKPKGTVPGRLAKVVQGKNLLAGKVNKYRRYFRGLYPGHNPQKEEVVVFKSGKPCILEFSARVDVGAIGMILEGKRTRAKTGAIPYFIMLIDNQLYKIDSNCVEFIDQNNLTNC
jgi:hypothetical protein